MSVQAYKELLQRQLALPEPVPIITGSEFESMKKNISERMYHCFNETLTYILTTSKVCYSYFLKKPELARLTIYFELTASSENQEKTLSTYGFPLDVVNHPLADTVQSSIILREFQYWADIIELFKKRVFSEKSLSSYNHNTACAIKPLIKKQLSILEKKTDETSKKRSRLSDLIEDKNGQEYLFLSIQESFHFILQDCFKSIHDSLPSVTHSFVNVAKAPLETKKLEKIMNKGKDEYENSSRKLEDEVDKLNAYYNQNLITILKTIQSKAIMESLNDQFEPDEVEELLETLPFYKQAEQLSSLASVCGYEELFGGVTKNIKNLQKIRENLCLSPSFLSKINPRKLMSKALKQYNESTKLSLPEQTKISSNNSLTLEENYKEEITKPNENNATQEFEEVNTLIETENDKNSQTDIEIEEDIIYDQDYFKSVHEYHQNKKKTSNSNNKSKTALHEVSLKTELDIYKENLFGYLMETIYTPKKRPTWEVLVKGLSTFGFKGNANKLGNGSVWQFSVTDKNLLFFDNSDYKGAQFNVHEFRGNEPIPSAYLEYFQSGFSNVFGLTRDSISKYLEQHK